MVEKRGEAMTNDDDDGGAVQEEPDPQASTTGVIVNPMAPASGSKSALDLTDIEPGKYMVSWKTVRGMMALHVSLTTDMTRLYKMQMNRAQKVLAFTLAFVYGTGQVCT